MSGRVSIVIPCRDAADTLAEQLAALAGQRYDGDWEVVVVDDGSTDGTAAVAAGFADRLPSLTVVSVPEPRNAARARNVGVTAATGDLLLFCDADDVVGAGWVAALAAALQRSPIVGGASDIERLNPLWAQRTRSVPQRVGLQDWGVPGWDLVHGGPGNLGITRALYDEVGPFDESGDVAVAEGVDYYFRAQLAGHEPVFVPEAVIHIRLRGSLRSAYRQARGWAEGSVAIHRRYARHGMPRPAWLRGLAAWGLVPIRLLGMRDRGDLARWVHLLGWRVGRLRGSVRYRTLAF